MHAELSFDLAEFFVAKMRKATQQPKTTNESGEVTEPEKRIRTRRTEQTDPEGGPDRHSSGSEVKSHTSLDSSRDVVPGSFFASALKYLPYMALVGAVVTSFVFAVQFESPSNSSSSTGVCWDKKIRIQVIPDAACRTIYINMTSKTPFLLLVLYALLRTYLSQLVGLVSLFARMIGLLTGDATACGHLKSWDHRKRVVVVLGWDLLARVIWIGTTAFATFYSAHVLFIYMNDNYYSLFAVQGLLTFQQLCVNSYIGSLFKRRTEALETALRYPETAGAAVGDLAHWSVLPGIVGSQATGNIGSAILGMVLFKISFNVFIESLCGEGTLVLRTIMFLLGDVGCLVVILWLDGAYQQMSAALVGTSRASAPATEHWGLASLFRARMGRERLHGVQKNKKHGLKGLWMQHLLILVTTLASSAVFLWASIARTGERIC